MKQKTVEVPIEVLQKMLMKIEKIDRDVKHLEMDCETILTIYDTPKDKTKTSE